MEKSVVLPYEMFAKLSNSKHDGIEPDPILELEAELRNILSNNSSDLYEKRMLYTQLLKKFVKSVQKERSDVLLPINNVTTTSQSSGNTNTNSATSYPVPITNSNTMQNAFNSASGTSAIINNSAGASTDNVYNTLVNVLGKRSSKNAGALYSYVKRIPQISWDDNTGEVSLNGTSLPGSNIIDILSDLSKILPKGASYTDPPSGTYDFLKCLQSVNIPKILVKNVSRFRHINTPAHYPAKQSQHNNCGSRVHKRRMSSPDIEKSNKKLPRKCIQSDIGSENTGTWLRYS